MNRAASIWHSITENWGIRNSVVLIFAATPICVAMFIYISTDWFGGGACGSGVNISFDPRCSDDLRGGFLFLFAILCLALAFCYWFIGSIASAVLLAIKRDAGRSAFAGMAIGSGAATVTLLICIVVSYFVIDWNRLSWERKLIFSGASSPEAAGRLARMATDAGADINVKNSSGETPLHNAAEYSGNVVLLRALLNAGADVHAEDRWGRTPLHAATSGRGKTVLLGALLGAGADVHAKDNMGRTPLYLAVRDGESETVRSLLNAGSDVNAEDNNGVTPLYVAVGGTRYVAAGDDELETIRLLLNAGADINAENDDGRTPFHVAVSGELEMTRLFLAAGADVNTKNSDGITPLHVAAGDGGIKLEMIRLLLNAGADTNAKNNDGDTPFHTAARDFNPVALEALLAAGADITTKNNDGDTPLDVLEDTNVVSITRDGKRFDVIKFLEEAAAGGR